MAAERQWQHGRHPLGVVLQKVIEGYSRNFLTID